VHAETPSGPSFSPRDSEGARVLIVALAAVAPAEGANAPAEATAACQRLLVAWRDSVGAPNIEVRRAARRLAAVFGRLSPERVDDALASLDAGEAARALVDECARLDRDFGWDVPLRDVSRAIVEAAVRGVRASGDRS
jgi:hypothetical protein